MSTLAHPPSSSDGTSSTKILYVLCMAIKTEYSYRTRTGICRRVEAEERGGDTPMGVNEPSIVVPSTR
ncbi:White-opaque regulator 2 [Fusarium oxysporum f. sp. albedinis]|nr:White-opaque regulator 2 [Fusarium oxysporum f. sp. albedinis]